MDVDVILSPDPPQIGVSTVLVTLADAQGGPITGAVVDLEGNMDHAGMVPTFSRAVEVGSGRYEAQMEFTMGGDWFLLVQAKLPDGRTLERKVDVPGVDLICGETPAP